MHGIDGEKPEGIIAISPVTANGKGCFGGLDGIINDFMTVASLGYRFMTTFRIMLEL